MNDYILRVTAKKGAVRGFFANTRNMANESYIIHNTTPVVTAAMGRLLTATSMVGLMLKHDKDLVTIRLKGDGPMKGILATADCRGYVKGYPTVPNVDIPCKSNGKLDVGGAIGVGTLAFTKDMGLKEPYSGQIPLVSGEIAEDLTHYFAKSEQTPTSVALGVLVDVDYSVKQSGGFIIQLMPDCDEDTINVIEEKLNNLPSVTNLLEIGKSIEEISQMILGELDLVIHEKIEVKYSCNCNVDKVSKALNSIGKEEILDILDKEKEANIECHFCKKNYYFDESDLKKML